MVDKTALAPPGFYQSKILNKWKPMYIDMPKCVKTCNKI